jgi:glutaminase
VCLWDATKRPEPAERIFDVTTFCQNSEARIDAVETTLNGGPQGASSVESDSFERILSVAYRQTRAEGSQGKLADYIPELSLVSPDQLGIAIATLDGRIFSIGSADVPFSIQSISKVFSLTLAMKTEGDALWSRIGREPSGTPFNSLVLLETEHGRPRNPFVNAGALVVTDVLCSRYAVPENAVTEFLQGLVGNRDLVNFNVKVADSERKHSGRNAAMLHFMQSHGNIVNPVDQVLSAYCGQCSIEMSCTSLARAMVFLANNGCAPLSGTFVISPDDARRINSMLLLCGSYDEAGDFAFRVGLPAKTGVGGGIVAVVPGRCGICVWSPLLNERGNSVAGTRALELLTELTGWSIF